MNPEDPNASAPAEKVWWKSKVVLLNILALVSLAVPAVAEWVKNNPVEPMAALAALNVLVRFVTSGKVTLFSDDDTSGNASPGTGVGPFGGNSKGTNGDSGASWFSPSRKAVVPWLVAASCAVVFLFTGCTPAQLQTFREIPITIGVEGEHGTYAYSSKGGLSVTVKGRKVREEKSAPDFGKILAREWEAGRYEPCPLRPVPVEVWPPSTPRPPRRMVLP
jgi:hypothetical protein